MSGGSKNHSLDSSRHRSIPLSAACFVPGTDINLGVLRGVDMLVKDRQENRLPERSVDMVILLTDGMPVSGEFVQTNPQ